jgi:hypothetical protein
VAVALLEDGAEMFRTKECLQRERFKAAAGSFIVKNSPEVQKILPALLEKWHLSAHEVESIESIPKAPLRKPRVALYQSWRSNMDEGWTRYVFDDMEIPFTTLHNKDFKGTKKKKVNLKEEYDVIVFASENPEIIKSGKPGPDSPYARRYTEMPPEYEGGIGKEGIEALKKFVERGGTLVTLNDACNLVFKEFKVPARNAIEKVDREKFFCPTSLLKLKVDNTTPIGYGMPEEAAAMFSRSLVMSTWVPQSGDWDRKVVASYPKENILMSGWLLGEDVIARKAAVVDAKYIEGHIVLIGIRCQHRAQSHGTYKFLLNALLYPEEAQ